MATETGLDLNGIFKQAFDAQNQALRVVNVVEGFYIPVTAMQTAATIITTNDVPRAQFPDAATTSAWCTFVMPGTWTQADIGLLWTGSTAGVLPIRWRIGIKKLANFIDNISEAFAADVSANLATPASAGVLTLTPAHIDNLSTVPDAFGTTYSLLIQRVGADGGDTYTGVGEFLGINFARV